LKKWNWKKPIKKSIKERHFLISNVKLFFRHCNSTEKFFLALVFQSPWNFFADSPDVDASLAHGFSALIWVTHKIPSSIFCMFHIRLGNSSRPRGICDWKGSIVMILECYCRSLKILYYHENVSQKIFPEDEIITYIPHSQNNNNTTLPLNANSIFILAVAY
jgi:hypothetical protein